MPSPILSEIDLFGTYPSINLNGSRKSYSLIGLTLTGFIAVVFIWMLVYLTKDVAERKNPTFVNSILRESSSKVITLPRESSHLGFMTTLPRNFTSMIASILLKQDFTSPRAMLTHLGTTKYP